MDFSTQVPPTISEPEPILSSAPPLTSAGQQAPLVEPLSSPATAPQSSSPAPRRSLKWLWWSLGGVVLVGLLGGGYFAYSRGFISIPYLTPKSDSLFNKMVSSIGDIKSAQYELSTKIEGQPRNHSLKPLFDSNSNANNNSSNSNIDELGTFPISEEFKSLMTAIPADLKIQGGVTIYVETGKLIQDANALFAINGSYTGSDVSVAVDLELRKVGKDLYGIVRKFPSLPIPEFDLSSIKGKWVVATPDDSIFDVSTSAFENQDLHKSVDLAQSAMKRALDNKLVTVKQHLPAETIGGVRSEHYLLDIHPDKLATVITAIRDDQKAKGNDTSVYDDALTSLKNPEVSTLMQRIADNSRFEVWIDKTKGFLRQWRWGLTIVPDDSIEKLKDRQVYVEFTATTEKVNENVSVSKPSSTIDFDEATRLVTGITKDEQLFDKQNTRVGKVRSALSLYKSQNGSYPASLDALNTSLKSIYSECVKKADATKTDKTNDVDAQNRDAKRKSDIAQLRTALALYYDDNNSTYPTDLSVLANGSTYISKVPTDPSTNANYSYQVCAGNHFILNATLETTTEKYYANDIGAMTQSSTPITCPANTNTSSGPTSFSIESIGDSIGLGGYNSADYTCSSEKQYQNGINITDVYTNKDYGYSLDGSDYKLTYQLNITNDVSSYEKDYYVDGQNTATSTDTSVEKTSPYEISQQQYQDSLKNANTNSSTNTSVTPQPIAIDDIPPVVPPNIPSNHTLDTDGDGLSDYLEITVYRTNPNMKDSDNDGYTDANEITNQYNPLGAGKASSQQLLEWGVAPITTSGAPALTSTSVSSADGYITFSFTTNTAADAVVNYGETTAYGKLLSNKDLTTTHLLRGGAYSGHTYHYSIRTCTNGACYSTPDATIVAQGTTSTPGGNSSTPTAFSIESVGSYIY